MKLQRLIVPSAVIASAVVFFGSTQLEAFTFDGNILDLNNRDFRVYNNFTDPTANDNVTPSVNYPGSLGAVQALWKAAAEWDSQPVGTGAGDPTQPILGSGGANFDACFAGKANAAGVMGDNIISELAGSNGGVLAFTEIPGSPGGWRILFYSVWEWCDGPSFITGGGNSFDLQCVGCHEFGHALGLGHTPVVGATMEASVAALNVAPRSIEPDDIAGVQALYAPKSASKLTVSSFTGSGNPIRITGTNFPGNAAEVWFTSKNLTSPTNAVPIKVSGLTTTGTTVDVNVPATAGIGAIHVRNGLVFAHTSLSNPLPYDPAVCPKPLNYCTGKLNSQGFVPTVNVVGSNSLAIGGGNLLIECNNGVPNKPGLFLYTDNGPASIPFQNGTLCLNPPVVRSPPFIFDTFGYASWNTTFGGFDVGAYRHFQTWYRDPLSPDGVPVGLSDAIEVKFCP